MSRMEIRFGLRRFALAMAMFGVGGVGFMVWSQRIEGPTFIFPFGTLEPENARIVLLGVGVLALAYAATLAYIRWVKRPMVVIDTDEIQIPLGEFATGRVTLRAGDVLEVREEAARAGGWRTCFVKHRGGTIAVRSSQLPSDHAFTLVTQHLRALQNR